MTGAYSNGRLARGYCGKRRKAFTLIELLVTIGIIALLLALLLPAVQMARAAGYRTVCANNLRQIGLALNAYVSQHNFYPAGRTYGDHSAFCALLPHLEQDELYHQLNFDVASYDHANETVRRTSVNGFLCPADIRPVTAFGGTNYAVCNGRGKSWFGEEGIFGVNPPWRASQEITDGTTHTAAAAEWVRGARDSQDRQGLIFSTPRPRIRVEIEYVDEFLSACRGVDTSGPAGVKGVLWINGAVRDTIYNHLLTPNDNNCTNAGDNFSAAITAGSRHPGGAHVLFADSSVRFISTSIDMEPWRAFSTRSAGDR